MIHIYTIKTTERVSNITDNLQNFTKTEMFIIDKVFQEYYQQS